MNVSAREKLDATELKPILLQKADYRCVVCGKHISPGDVWDLAHRVNKGKGMIEQYGREVIFHPLNMVPTCNGTKAGRSCNDRCNLKFRRAEAHELIQRIVRITTGRESEPDMAEEYRKLRAEFVERWKDST